MHVWKHFVTITKHRHLVMKYCFKLRIPWQGLIHDLSKYSYIEFYNGAKFYQGTRSPNDQEREVKGYSEAWMHHKGRNKHHYEYWVDVNLNTNEYEAVKMPIKYLKEMLADRIAASRIYKGKAYTDASPYEYFITHAAIKRMHPESVKIMNEWLLKIKNEGEKATFKYIKKNYPNSLKY
ncbi:MAG: catalase [Erysipelotrichales bacterium]|nr:catalase [Erysipelotrichales bacterium]